jgi:UDP:flavonoid glycosyltransferase YjiC (YdhE family)
MVVVATDLVARGHEVVFLGGRRFQRQIERSGARFVPLPEECDWDDRDQDAAFPGRARRPGPLKMLFDARTAFCDPMPHQARAVAEILRGFPADAILIDCVFTGIAPMILDGRMNRPPVVVCGVLPLMLSSRDTAPFGLGLTPGGRVRDAVLGVLVREVAFASVTRHANALLAEQGLPRLPMFLLDTTTLADRVLQFTTPAFEYPRSDLAPNVRFVGPIPASAPEPATLPDWWDDLDSGRPVVHVTQGTLDNVDLGKVIGPTLRGLAGDDVLVVVATGGVPVPQDLPCNARAATFLPYDRLLPKVDVMVTNGGYGGVQAALGHGIPLVIAGATEDKPEVAARVRWSGAGIDLRSGRPRPHRIRAAVREVLSDPGYRASARRVAADFACYDALGAITATLEELRPATLGA